MFKVKAPKKSKLEEQLEPQPRESNMSRRDALSMIREREGLREINDSERNVSNNSRIRLDRSKAQERDLTPSRIINSSKNTRLSNQVIVATGDKHSLQVQRVPICSLM